MPRVTRPGPAGQGTAVKAHANRAEALKASVRIREKLRVRDEQGTWTSQAPYGFKNQRRKDGKVGVFLDRRGTVLVAEAGTNQKAAIHGTVSAGATATTTAAVKPATTTAVKGS